MSFLIPALNVIGSIVQHNRNKKAINRAKKMTSSERAYSDRLRKRSEQGDPQFEQTRNRVMSGIRNVAQEAQGQNINQALQMGLQDSVIAQELRLRTDSATMKQISESSQELAQANQQIKEQAQSDLDQFNLQRDDRIRQLNLQKTQSSNAALSNILGSVGDAAVGIMNRNKPQIQSFGGGYSITRGGKTTLFAQKKDANGNITYEEVSP